ncbi:phage terminase large subunit [Roseateles sp. PN1]|uniref:phage terminase large subunit n=1 Tax=Roseateles sp. PN1 TaxID=3137372 RepID=UPI003138EC72
MAKADISLLGFACDEYERRGWGMPDVHVRIFDWFERTEGARNRVLMVFRGCGKSTILGVRNAHRYRKNPLHQLLVQGADDDLADDISRDTIAIMRGNTLVGENVLMEPAGIRHWFTHEGFSTNARTPQFRGRGILSRVTGNRADEIINDDTEMSKNVENPEARAKLRKRLSEQSFILKPGGSVLWVGTPHTHDSIYDQKIAAGAEALVVPLFQHQTRHNAQDKPHRSLAFSGDVGPDGVWVFVGIGPPAQLLEEGKDYTVKGQQVLLKTEINGLVDICVGNAWPERFDRKEMLQRRRDCETLNYWDQQYQLEAKPLSDSRLNPDRMIPYDLEPVWKTANGESIMLLGGVRIVAASCRWDPASGKLKSDVSAVAVVLQDESGVRYLHRIARLTGDVVEFAADGKTVTGGQVHQLCDIVEALRLPRVTIETNGIGKFSPAILKGALKQRRLVCGVAEETSTANKNKRILEALEPLLTSGEQLWAHVSVTEGPLPAQMRDWNPAIKEQPDDYLDAAGGAVSETPERIMRAVAPRDGIPTPGSGDSWRPSSGVHAIELETGFVD